MRELLVTGCGGVRFRGVLVTGCGAVIGRKSEFPVGFGMMTVCAGCDRSSARLTTALPGVMPKILTAWLGLDSEVEFAGGVGVVEATGAGGGVVVIVLLMTTVLRLPDDAGGSVV